jgi:hypothetical protein
MDSDNSGLTQMTVDFLPLYRNQFRNRSKVHWKIIYGDIVHFIFNHLRKIICTPNTGFIL